MHVQNDASTANGFKSVNLFLNFMADNGLDVSGISSGSRSNRPSLSI